MQFSFNCQCCFHDNRVFVATSSEKASITGMDGSREGRGTGGRDPPPPEKSQKYRVFFSNTGSAFNVGLSLTCQRNAI